MGILLVPRVVGEDERAVLPAGEPAGSGPQQERVVGVEHVDVEPPDPLGHPRPERDRQRELGVGRGGNRRVADDARLAGNGTREAGGEDPDVVAPDLEAAAERLDRCRDAPAERQVVVGKERDAHRDDSLGFVELLEILRLDLAEPLADLFRIIGLHGLGFLRPDLEALCLADALFLHVDGRGHPEGQGDGVRGSRVDRVLGLGNLDVKHREEGVLLEISDDDLEHARVDRLQDVLDQIVGHGPRGRDLLELERDGVGFEDAYPDGERALVLLVAPNDDRHVGQWVERQPAHLHLDKHTVSSGSEASAPRRLWGSTSVISIATMSPTAARPSASKVTTRLQRVRPWSSRAFLRDGPSTSTSTTRSWSRRLRSAAVRAATSSRRLLRWAFTSSGICSGIVAAGVPRRREVRETKTVSYATRATRSQGGSQSCS